MLNKKTKTETHYNSGMNISSWLTVLFVGLKLTGYIDWPWIWVVSPIWISLLIFLLILALIGTVYAIAYFLDKK